MPVDVTALAEIVSGNIYRGMQSRAQRRQQEEQARANREAEMAREVALQQANARLGMEQVNQQNMDQFRRATLDLNQSIEARRKREGVQTDLEKLQKAEAENAARSVAISRLVDLIGPDQLTPEIMGNVSKMSPDAITKFTTDLQNGKSIESMKKTAKAIVKGTRFLKPDLTDDTAATEMYGALAENISSQAEYESLAREVDQYRKWAREHADKVAGEERKRVEQAAMLQQAGPLIEKARAGTATGDEIAWLRANNILGQGDVIPTKGTPPDVAEPLRKRVNDLDSQIKMLETQLEGKIDPMTGEVNPRITGKGWSGGTPNVRDANAGSIEQAASQLSALKQERQATYDKLNQVTASQPGVPGGAVSLTGGMDPAAALQAFVSQYGRKPTREEWAAMRPTTTPAQPR